MLANVIAKLPTSPLPEQEECLNFLDVIMTLGSLRTLRYRRRTTSTCKI